MKIFSLLFLLIISFPNICFSAEKAEPEFKPTSEKLKEKNITEKDMCKLACESAFSKCLEENKANPKDCETNTSTCKTICK